MTRSIYTTSAFWQAAVERAIRTLAQGALAAIGTDAIGVMDADWAAIGSVAVMAAVLSLLMSIATASTGTGIALGPETVDTPVDDDPQDAGIGDPATHRTGD